MASDPVQTRSGILEALGASCRDDARRELLLANPTLGLNGIDFVEFVQPAGANMLRVHFLFSLPAGLYQLPTAHFPTIRIEGGARIVGIKALTVTADATDATVLDITVSAQGDFSTYWLSVGWSHVPADDSWAYQLAGIDRQFSVAPINFRPGCPIDFDCAPAPAQAPAAQPAPPLDYLARDYASFRQLLLDLISQRNPTWVETSPADLGIALVELLAYQGDYLSYFQDVVANELFLDTARKRLSAKRHAHLVDYRMHDGRNAWAYVYFEVSATLAGATVELPPGQQLLTRVDVPLRNQVLPPGTMIASGDLDFDKDQALARALVFETAASVRLSPLNNELRLHTWGNVQCCLCMGATVCHLHAVDGTNKAVIPDLKPGDLLLFEEVKSPITGAAADADPTHRQVVRILRVDQVADPLYDVQLSSSGNLQVASTTSTSLPLLEIGWAPVDALTFPLSLSTTLTDGSVADRLSVARGNIALADHGRTVQDSPTLSSPVPAGYDYLLTLALAPLTMQCQLFTPSPNLADRTDLTLDVQSVTPAVQLAVTGAVGGQPEQWGPVPDLLESNEFAPAFVVDVDDDGQGILRFGDDQYGRSMTGATKIVANYRVGNGRSGNIGAEGLAHIVTPASIAGLMIQKVRNPLPARDGTDPETIEQVRQYAPAAFQAVQYRAVTEADYEAAARTVDGVAGAVAQFRWTGSWYTVYLGIDPSDPVNVVTLSGGRTSLDPTFATTVTEALEKFQLAGYDLEVRSAQYVPLLIEVHVCVSPDHFQADVVAAVRLALSNGTLPNGKLGFFNPANFAFGQPVYLSRLYAAIAAVEGVGSAEIIVFQRYGRQPQGELQKGVILMGPWEIARLDNDVNLKENGTLVLDADGGK